MSSTYCERRFNVSALLLLIFSFFYFFFVFLFFIVGLAVGSGLGSARGVRSGNCDCSRQLLLFLALRELAVIVLIAVHGVLHSDFSDFSILGGFGASNKERL